jgi:hypothetical protein
MDNHQPDGLSHFWNSTSLSRFINALSEGTAVLVKSGVKVRNIVYKYQTKADSTVTSFRAKYNPKDLSHIYIYDPNASQGWVELDANT